MPGPRDICDFEDDGEDESDGGWQDELQRRYEQDANFMAELRARQANSPGNNPAEVTGFPHSGGYQYQQNSSGHHYGENNYSVQQNMFVSAQQNHTGNGSQNYVTEEYGSGYNRSNSNQRLFGQQPAKPKQYSQEHENGQGYPLMKEQNQDKIQFEEALKQWVNR
ncbi:hypothetical protein WA026_011703 [Henosepilachna vigintioctopunctata]|uniref:Uncharacterized protein n=1 Tax=Henosepilachna vigintioctopunctata TaxID=420089 RepID=A0AAW1UK22_9CUCU